MQNERVVFALVTLLLIPSIVIINKTFTPAMKPAPPLLQEAELGMSTPINCYVRNYVQKSMHQKKIELITKYVKQYKRVALIEQARFGIPYQITLAQGILESKAGQGVLAKKNKNHFGIKCFSKKCKKGHCSNFSDDHHKDFFRKYKSAWESWRDHSKMISTGRYKHIKPKCKGDLNCWCLELKKRGYATDKQYAEKLEVIINKYIK